VDIQHLPYQDHSLPLEYPNPRLGQQILLSPAHILLLEPLKPQLIKLAKVCLVTLVLVQKVVYLLEVARMLIPQSLPRILLEEHNQAYHPIAPRAITMLPLPQLELLHLGMQDMQDMQDKIHSEEMGLTPQKTRGI
jgi:hypothetical protein